MADSIKYDEKELSVYSRATPAYNPANIKFGEFIVAPSLKTFGRYTDNIYASNTNKTGDFIYGVRPELGIKSDFQKHEIETALFFEDGNYRQLSEEDYQDYGGKFSGRYDFYRGFSLPFTLGYQKGHLRRDDPEDRKSIDPTIFKSFTGMVGIKASNAYLDLNGGSGFLSIKYDDTTAFTGAPIDNSDRDRTVFSNSLSLGLSEDAIVAPFVYAKHQLTRYDQEIDNFNISRDSTDLEGGVGANLNFSRMTRSSLRIGQVRRNFENSSMGSITALTYSARLNWEPSPLTAFLLTAARDIKETSTNASAELDSYIALKMTYELCPNILLEPEVKYIHADYEDSSYKTKAYNANMLMSYKLNPNVWSILEYNYISEDQGGDTALGFDPEGYDENKISLTFKLQL